MMGFKERVFSPFPPDVSLEELVPKDHFHRRLEERIDLSFVREMVAPLYAGGGRPSVDPMVFFKLQLVMFEKCVESGLVWGEELFVDSTTVQANAAKGALVPRWAVREHLGALFVEQPTDPDGEARGTADETLPSADDADLRAQNSAREDFVSSAGRHGTRSGSPNPNKISDHVVNKADPDACLAGHIKGTARMGYKAHYVVDGGRARVILTALVTKADVKDNQPMLDLIWHTTFRWGLRPHHVTGDSVYGTIPNLKSIEGAGIRAYMPAIDYTWGKRTLFRKDDFAYDAERDVYVCPAGQILRNTGSRKKLRLTRYVADPAKSGREKTCWTRQTPIARAWRRRRTSATTASRWTG